VGVPHLYQLFQQMRIGFQSLARFAVLRRRVRGQVDVEITAAFRACGRIGLGVSTAVQQVEQQQPGHRGFGRCLAQVFLQQVDGEVAVAVRHVDLGLVEDVFLDLGVLSARRRGNLRHPRWGRGVVFRQRVHLRQDLRRRVRLRPGGEVQLGIGGVRAAAATQPGDQQDAAAEQADEQQRQRPARGPGGGWWGHRCGAATGLEFGVASLQREQLRFQMREAARKCRGFVGKLGLGQRPLDNRVRGIRQVAVEAQGKGPLGGRLRAAPTRQHQARCGFVAWSLLRAGRGRRARGAGACGRDRARGRLHGRGGAWSGWRGGLHRRGRCRAGLREAGRVRRIEQNHVFALQARFAVCKQHELRDRIVEGLAGTDMQHGLVAVALQAQVHARRWRDGTGAGSELETVCGEIGADIEHHHGGVQRLPEEGAYIELAQPEGRDSAGMAQAQQEADGFEAHTIMNQGKYIVFRLFAPQL
jgi:hypothetical protein